MTSRGRSNIDVSTGARSEDGLMGQTNSGGGCEIKSRWSVASTCINLQRSRVQLHFYVINVITNSPKEFLTPATGSRIVITGGKGTNNDVNMVPID